jgi:hypothetical protein
MKGIVMNQRFILFRRNRVFYSEDTTTGKQISLRTKDLAEAKTLLHAKNESVRQPAINLQIARAYLTACDPQIARRTWQDVMDAILPLKAGSTQVRWQSAINSAAYDSTRLTSRSRSSKSPCVSGIAQQSVFPNHDTATPPESPGSIATIVLMPPPSGFRPSAFEHCFWSPT